MTDYSDIVKRLRENGIWTSDKVWESHPDCAEAADAIEAQANRIEELEASLIICKRAIDNWDMDKSASSQARKVLGEKE